MFSLMFWSSILAFAISSWILFRLAGSPRDILSRLVKGIASITTRSTTSISNDERRWVVIGVCLAKVLTPALRNILATEIPKWHQVLCQPPTKIDKQVSGRHQKKLPPSTWNLNYQNINNNDATGLSPSAFNYAVRDPLSLAKLFVKPFMSKFTGFDITMDTSAVLSVIGEAAPFARAAAYAKKVRSDIRNEWAHCNFSEWTEQNFADAFKDMENLIKNLNLPPDDEQKLCDELNSWKGFQLCFAQGMNIEMLKLLRGEMDELYEAVRTWELEKEQMTTLMSNITDIKSNLSKQIDDLRTTVEKHSEEINDLKKKFTTELSRVYIKEEEKIPYVFTAPPPNQYFSGRTEEVQELKRILNFEETLNEKKIRVAAVCGLGGIGKTSLVSEYAHQMKDFYKGGVYWFSAEDDAHLSRTVNAVAVRIGALLNSFDLTLPNILKKISTLNDPCLIVLDCLDELDISSNVMEFLSFPSQENIFGHFIVVTRRNPTRLVNEVSVIEEEFCLQLKCLPLEEAKQFLFSRSKVVRDENVESDAECLCEELGRLPLALEQAGAYIQSRRLPNFTVYLEQYKAQRSRLLRRKRARAASNDSRKRLAVHTTWLINMEYMKISPDGQAAVCFMNACSFFDRNEIQEQLINVGTPAVENVAYHDCVTSQFGSREVLTLLTDFSLFTYVEEGCVSTHRLVHELIWENLDAKSKAESFIDAVRMLSHAFSKCHSPSDHVSLDERNSEEQGLSFSDPPDSRSHFYMWSKFCMHGYHLRRNLEDLLVSLDPVWLDSVWSSETAKILYECAIHLSANHQQEEAKRTLNFAYRILDWLPVTGYDVVERNVSENYLFPLPIPLPELYQMMIQRFCEPTSDLSNRLTGKPAPVASDLVHASELASDAADLTPVVINFASDELASDDLAPHAGSLASVPSNFAPVDFASGAADLAAVANDLAPDHLPSGDASVAIDFAPDDFDPNAAHRAPVAIDFAPDDFDPNAAHRAPVAIDFGSDDLAPDAVYPAPVAADLAPNNLALDDLAPDPADRAHEVSNRTNHADDHITRRSYLWRAFALKALDGFTKDISTGLNDNASVEIAAALAFYYNRSIFEDFPIFLESFPNLQSRIFICDNVDELLYAMFSQELETGLMKILVLGSEEYILNSEIVGKSWNNCILVGTRKNRSVTLKSDHNIPLSKCMLTNLSFSFNKCLLHCLPDSLVKVLNCNFNSCDDYEETVKTEGTFDAEQCNFTRSPLLCATGSRAVVRDCSFCNNAKKGLRVEEGGALRLENSRIYNNAGRGLFVFNSECVIVVKCDIHHNGDDGIILCQSENVTLMHNSVHNNNGDGIRILESKLVDVKENSLSDNGTWGVLSQDNRQCKIVMNKIFGNKSGGVYVLCEPEEGILSLPVMEKNKISHNGGPAFVVNREVIKVSESFHSNSSNSFQPANLQSNEMHHNKDNDSKLNLSVPYCSYCRVKCNPTVCENCLTTAYCSNSCQEQHRSKHKDICRVLREKSSYLVTPEQEVENLDMVACCPKDRRPNLAFPPQDDNTRFVAIVGNWVLLSNRTFLYDPRHGRAWRFESKLMNQLVTEFGVLCDGKLYEKKLYFHCLAEENGKFRLFTNDFAEFQH